MDFSTILNQKTEIRDSLKENFSFPKRPKTIVLIALKNAAARNFIGEGLSILPVNFILLGGNSEEYKDIKNVGTIADVSKIDLRGIDAIICDNESGKIEDFMKEGIVPIICESNYLGKFLTEFSAARAEGNAYIYQDDSAWAAYYALIRYLENLKFPYDNRNLVKNVLGM